MDRGIPSLVRPVVDISMLDQGLRGWSTWLSRVAVGLVVRYRGEVIDWAAAMR